MSSVTARIFLPALMFLSPALTAQGRQDIAAEFSLESIKTRFDTTPTDAIEGIWQLTDSGGRIAVIRQDDTTFRILVVDSPDRTIFPGTIMGTAHCLAKRGHYDAEIMTSSGSGRLKSPKRFTLRLNDDGHLSFIKINKGLRVNLWRVLPYMFRYSVREINDRQHDLDGAIKIYPRPMSIPSVPRYL